MQANLVPPTVDALVEGLRHPDADIRGNAWQNAGPLSAPAVPRVMALMDDPEPETARAARRALYEIVRLAGRPGADAEALAVESGLLAASRRLVQLQARRDVLWMLSEIGQAAAVRHLAALLTDADLREDARCALMRIPGDASLAALQQAHDAATDAFRDALAEALVHRGQDVPGFQSRKLKPTKTTTVGSSPV